MINPAVVKLGINLLVTSSTSKVIRAVVVHNTPIPATNLAKIQMIVGTWALGSLAGAATSKRVDDGFDQVVEFIEERKIKTTS